jgi:hypothetical protein
METTKLEPKPILCENYHLYQGRPLQNL